MILKNITIFFFLLVLASCSNLQIFSDNKKIIKEDSSKLSKDSYSSLSDQEKKVLEELENYESYRPDSFSDASRNPFNENKRYDF